MAPNNKKKREHGLRILLFNNCSKIIRMTNFNTNKITERYLNTNYIALEELKEKEINENTNKSTKLWLKSGKTRLWRVNNYDVDIENYPMLS
jgi:hypothetical protein